ncbi:MAG: ATP-binding cassette domain-containing protein, partial [Bacillota bacterium]
MRQPLVRMTDVWKRFGRVTALAGAQLSVYAGEIHVILGENGAGKTSLM